MAVQRVLNRARTGVRLGASASPDGEEARALLLAGEEIIRPLLAYAQRMVSGKPWLPCGTSSGT